MPSSASSSSASRRHSSASPPCSASRCRNGDSGSRSCCCRCFSFFTFRRTLYQKLRAGGEDYRDSIVGESVRILNDLEPGADGRTEYRGSDWTVRNVGNARIMAGTRATVTRVDGLTLDVRSD